MRHPLLFSGRFVQFSVILAVMFVVGFTASEKVIAQQNTAANLSSLLAKAQAKGVVPIIIKLNVNFQPEDTLSSQQVIAQQKAIANAQNSIVQSLVGMNATGIKTYQFTPSMAVTVDSAALQSLANNPLATEIIEDIAVPPTMRSE